jgi:hypothetical protein
VIVPSGSVNYIILVLKHVIIMMPVASKLGKLENILYEIQFLLVSHCVILAAFQCTIAVYLTLCCQITCKDMIGIPCCVDRSHISMFSYTMSCTCIFQLVWLTYCFKVIDSLMQDVRVSSYKQTDES